jgi:hypothetical protein
MSDTNYTCKHEYGFRSYCGAHVCAGCDDHKGLDRCYCGWAASGGNGYRELLDMGEQIEEDY